MQKFKKASTWQQQLVNFEAKGLLNFHQDDIVMATLTCAMPNIQGDTIDVAAFNNFSTDVLVKMELSCYKLIHHCFCYKRSFASKKVHEEFREWIRLFNKGLDSLIKNRGASLSYTNATGYFYGTNDVSQLSTKTKFYISKVIAGCVAIHIQDQLDLPYDEKIIKLMVGVPNKIRWYPNYTTMKGTYEIY